MKKLIAALTLLTMSVTALVACGGSDQVTTENLASTMDQICTNRNSEFDDLGVRGLTNPAVVLEMQGTTSIREEILQDFKGIDADAAAQKQLDAYIAATDGIITSDKAVIAAAEKDDDAAVAAAFQKSNEAFAKRDAAAEEIGLKVCGNSPDIKVEPTGTEPPSDLEVIEPKNTVDEAASAYIKAAGSGDCKAINAARHEDAGTLEGEACGQVATSLAGAKIVGTEQYGPVGQAEVVSKDGVHYPTYFVTDIDGSDELRYAGDAIHDSGGLRPAPEGNDAEDAAEDVVDAIRDNDAAAFNETLPDGSSGFWVKGKTIDTFSDGKYNAEFVKDVRATDDEPVQLGLNSTWGFYFLPGSEHDWVMAMIHNPGTGGHYRFSGYYPIPKP